MVTNLVASTSSVSQNIWTSTSEFTKMCFSDISDGLSSIVTNLATIITNTCDSGVKALRNILISSVEATKVFVVNVCGGAYSLMTNLGASVVSSCQYATSSIGSRVSESFTTLQQAFTSSLCQWKEKILFINFLSPFEFLQQCILIAFDWIWNSVTGIVSIIANSIPSLQVLDNAWSLPYQTVSSLGSSLSQVVSSLSLTLASAWSLTSSLFLKTRTSPQEAAQTLDYDKIISSLLMNENFLTKVSSIANAKVEEETAKIQQKLAGISIGKTEEDMKIALESYNEQINKMKIGVEEEIKKISVQLLQSRLEDEQKVATEQELILTQMKGRFTEMMAQVERIQHDQAASEEEKHRDLIMKIDELKKNIVTLEEQQKELNNTLTSCCKNQTLIEVTVDKYISEFLDAVKNNNSNSELANWINSIFVAKSELESRLEELSLRLEENVKHTFIQEMKNIAKTEADQTAQHIMTTVSSSIQTEFQQRQINKTNDSVTSLSKEEVTKIVKNALIQYDADKTGLFDYALETAGGSVISTRCTETYVQKTAMYSIFGIPIWYPSNNPRTVIQPGVQPGECWAFKGSTGFIVIRLSDAIIPTRFSMEHISRTMSPSGRIDSAPREFAVYGLRSEKDPDPVKLGSYSYSEFLDPLQYFELESTNKVAYPYIELDILSNHGNMNYTCLYRFRVHGVLP